MNFGDIRLPFNWRLPELETAGDPAPTAAAYAFEAAISGVPSSNIAPSDFLVLSGGLFSFGLLVPGPFV